MGHRSIRLRDAIVANERQLFALLDSSAAGAERGLELLESVVHHWPDSEGFVSELSALCRASEERAEAVFAHVHQTYATVLEREDVLALSHALAGAVTHAEAVSWLLGTHRLAHSREHARRATHLLAGAGRELRVAVEHLRRLDDIPPAVTALREVERETRQLLRDGVADLIGEDLSAPELLAWKDILDELGHITDEVATATRALHAIELKG